MKGYIILVESLTNSFISRAIKFFTGKLAKKYGVKSYTHTMYGIGRVLDVESVISAELSITVMPLEKYKTKDYRFDVYAIHDGISEKTLNEILRSIYTKTAGDSYGFLQLLWFIYRWFMELLGFDVRKQKNWFPIGDVCSENTYRYLSTRLQNALDRNFKKKALNKVLQQLREWNENTFHPVDLAKVIKDNPEVFRHVYSWNLESSKFAGMYTVET